MSRTSLPKPNFNCIWFATWNLEIKLTPTPIYNFRTAVVQPDWAVGSPLSKKLWPNVTFYLPVVCQAYCVYTCDKWPVEQILSPAYICIYVCHDYDQVRYCLLICSLMLGQWNHHTWPAHVPVFPRDGWTICSILTTVYWNGKSVIDTSLVKNASQIVYSSGSVMRHSIDSYLLQWAVLQNHA